MTTLNLQVSASNRDGHSYGSTWPGYDGSNLTYESVGIEGDWNSYVAGGVSFTGVDIPANATITAMTLTVKASADSSVHCDVTIAGHDHANSPAFADTTDPDSGRPGCRTLTAEGTRVRWNVGTTAWTAGTKYTTPDLSPIGQAIIGKSGWARNNSMTFIFVPTNSAAKPDHAGPCRYFDSYDKTGNVSGVELSVTFTVAGGIPVTQQHLLTQGIR